MKIRFFGISFCPLPNRSKIITFAQLLILLNGVPNFLLKFGTFFRQWEFKDIIKTIRNALSPKLFYSKVENEVNNYNGRATLIVYIK